MGTGPSRRSVLRSISLSAAALAGCEAPTPTTSSTTTTATVDETVDGDRPSADEDRTTVDGEWPMFQFDARNAGYHPRAEGPGRTPVKKWMYILSDGIWSSPAVWNGTVYVGGVNRTLYAFDAATGSREWFFETGDIIFGSPAVDDGTVYVGSMDKTVYAVDARTGEREWSYETDGFVMSSPTIVGDTVYVGAHCHSFECEFIYDVTDHGYGVVYALDRETGDVRWQYETGNGVISTPAVHEGRVYVGSEDRKVYAIDSSTGDGVWEYETGGRVMSSPSLADGTIYIGSNDANVYAIDAESGTEEWIFETKGSYKGGSPAVRDDTVYMGIPGVPVDTDSTSDLKFPRGVVYALSSDSGEERWSYPTKAIEIGSTPAIASDVLYIGSHSEDSSYGALHAIGLDGDERWAFEVEGVGVGSSPAVVDGIVYFTAANGRIYALEEPTGGTGETNGGAS